MLILRKCDKCGKPMEGFRFVDGQRPDGTEFGYGEIFCVPCDPNTPKYPPQEALRLARVAQRISVRDAAERLDMDAVTLSGIEHGRVEADAETLDRIAALYARMEDAGC